VQAGQANVLAAQQNVGAAEANLHRLTDLQNFKKVRAPFAGVITLRNIDTGALIGNGSTMLFRIAQTDTLRIFINVPQANYVDLHVGASARINVRELGDRQFVGKISRVSGALDSNTRTMLTEIQIPNPNGVLLPGMYAQVHLSITRSHPSVVIPGEAVVTRSDGVFAALIDKNNRVHFRQIQTGRDYGLEVEVYSGLKPGDQVVISPSDEVRENVQVRSTPFRAPGVSTPAARKGAG
jgi:RND family efflux transporter MFP subunit